MVNAYESSSNVLSTRMGPPTNPADCSSCPDKPFLSHCLAVPHHRGLPGFAACARRKYSPSNMGCACVISATEIGPGCFTTPPIEVLLPGYGADAFCTCWNSLIGARNMEEPIGVCMACTGPAVRPTARYCLPCELRWRAEYYIRVEYEDWGYWADRRHRIRRLLAQIVA
jgi:hypothetical protein